MASAKMELRQWERSQGDENSVLSEWCCNFLEFSPVLGLRWNKIHDTLSFEIPNIDKAEILTKRKVLSIVQKIFDPIGILCPVLLHPKVILQETWNLKLAWDEELPKNITSKFFKWMEELPTLEQLTFPRCASGGFTSRERWQLHCFCDASQDAYAACVFLRTDDGKKVTVQLLQAKSRVAPLQKGKRPTILRLELLGCTIAARLSKAVKSALAISDNVSSFFWCDSTTALAWIRRKDEWGTFVGNRVREICRLSQSIDWRYVPGILNPADLPSRGCTPSQLMEKRWWEGPPWLLKSQETWPSEDIITDESLVLLEKRKSVLGLFVANIRPNPYFSTPPFSSYRRNVRVVAFVLRFIQGSRKQGLLRMGTLHQHPSEYLRAETALLKSVQDECFPTNDLVSNVKVERREDGLLHVKTKLLYRKDSEGFKYPILLPKSHPIVEQIIRQEHIQNCHAGVQFLMGSLREKYWVLQGRQAIRKVVSKCVTCRRHTAKSSQTEPSSLPEDRVKTAKVFEVIGVDLAGPLYVKTRRGRIQQKVWIVLFTCAVYRCVHLELTESLSTEDFLEAFGNFISRRGRPSVVYCDNGTNFVGADNALQALNWNQIMESSSMDRIIWKFNPPSAAWWGGWWERLISSVKGLLRRMLGNAKLTFQKLSSTLIKIEAVINGRPLTTVTEDPEDLAPLTPAMFLHEIPSSATEDLDACGFQKVNKEKKELLDEFKMRFRKEYLGLLVQRGKGSPIKFKIGDVVLVGADNQKRWNWPMAKIIELIPGKDGHIRVVKVKTANGILVRPVQRIYSLEVSSHSPPTSAFEKIEENKYSEIVTRFGRKVIPTQRFGQ